MSSLIRFLKQSKNIYKNGKLISNISNNYGNTIFNKLPSNQLKSKIQLLRLCFYFITYIFFI